MLDRQYTKLPNGVLKHHYGDNVFILQTAVVTTILSRLCSPETFQPEINTLTRDLYRQDLLTEVMNRVFPRRVVSRLTRMGQFTERGVYHGEVLDPDSRVVTVDIARAGMLPSQVCFELLCDILDSRRVRQDHLFMNRRTDDAGKVIGVDVSGSKIGGDQDGAIVLFPDPMGATGGSLSTAVSIYKEQVQGKAARYVALNLIITPQFIKRVLDDHPDVVIIAARLDRGMSDEGILQSEPGEHWDQEDGLNEKDYIVPGCGGFGELLNNAEQ